MKDNTVLLYFHLSLDILHNQNFAYRLHSLYLNFPLMHKHPLISDQFSKPVNIESHRFRF